MKRNILIVVLALILVLTAVPSFAENATERPGVLYNSPVQFYEENSKLSIISKDVDDDFTLEITQPDLEDFIYRGSLGEFESVQILYGVYHVALFTDYEIYYGSLDVTPFTSNILYDYVNMEDDFINGMNLENLSQDELDSISPLVGNTTYEKEPNNSFATANTYYEDDNMYGVIYTPGDVDYYKVKFDFLGYATFFLGNIPVGNSYDLEVYDSNYREIAFTNNQMGQTNQCEALVEPGRWYYVKVSAYRDQSSSKNYLFRAKNYDYYNWSGFNYFYENATKYNYISSAYGPRNGKNHYGFDITSGVAGGIKQVPIISACQGTVKVSNYSASEGYQIVVEHIYSRDPYTDKKFWIHYKHLDSKSPFSVNDFVSWEEIGKTGNSGESTGYHLHFQVNRDGGSGYNYTDTVNPILFYYVDYEFRNETHIYRPNISLYSLDEFEYDNLFYTVPGDIIDYVGIESFEEFIQYCKDNDEIVSIKGVIEYFGITKSEFENVVIVETEFDVEAIYKDESNTFEEDVLMNNLFRISKDYYNDLDSLRMSKTN